METLAPLDVFLFWSKCIPEHAVKPPALATDLGFAEFLSCVQISCQWGCGTYFDSSVAKFVATCVWNGYQISEMNLFVSSLLALLGERHWWAGATLADEDGSALFAWPVCQLTMVNCLGVGVTQKHLCSVLGHLSFGVRDPVWPFRIRTTMRGSQVSLYNEQKCHMDLYARCACPLPRLFLMQIL